MTIPRIIHQTWKTDEVPEPLRAYQRSWQRTHPDYEYRLWTDADNERLVRDHFPRLLTLYRSLRRGIHRADLARCLFLAKFGGIYVDLDVECLRRVDDLLARGGCILSAEPQVHARRIYGRDALVCNAAMASEPGHPFWQAVLDEIERRATDLRRSDDPVWTTGPLCVDHVAQGHGARLGVEVTDPDAFFPLPDLVNGRLKLSYRERRYYELMREHRLYPGASYGVHHWAHTWIASAGLVRRFETGLHQLSRLGAVLRGRTTIDEVLRPERYAVDFPGAAFAPRAGRREAMGRATAEGRLLAERSSIAVCVPIHNRPDIALLLRVRLRRLDRYFRHMRVFLVGDDSTDATRAVLRDWARAEPGRVRNVAVPALPSGAFGKMSALRNALLEAVDAEEPADYVMMLDGDLEGPLSPDGLLHALSLLEGARERGAVAAFGVNNWGGVDGLVPFVGYSYYDPLAFREHRWERDRTDAAVRLRLRQVRVGDAPIDALSAFAGAAIYKGPAIRGLRYPAAPGECEHVSFHRLLRDRGYRVAVDPAFVVLAGRQGHHAE